jgi:hypothetical protein
MVRKSFHEVLLLGALAAVACGKPAPLTAEKAAVLIRSQAPKREPIYAEVPEKVWWTPQSPKDDYDELALRTLRNLERAGLVTVTEQVNGDSATYLAKVTSKGFPILGSAPSYRGRALRGKICEKVYDGLENFVRHPTQPTVGHAELAWHYDNPTFLYPMFETKINKPLKTRFASDISFWYEKHEWRYGVNVRKVAATGAPSGAAPPAPR